MDSTFTRLFWFLAAVQSVVGNTGCLTFVGRQYLGINPRFPE